jgi:hypothetical protein
MSTLTATPANRCDRRDAVTRSLLGYGVLAGPFYLIAGLIEASTRSGYDITRHDLSLLADGPLGWIHVTVLVLTGAMAIAAAVGIGRALAGSRGGTWGPRLVAGYGLGLAAAGAFVADPMNGFPLGTPDGRPAHPSLHGTLHIVSGGLGFLCLIAATFVLAGTFARAGENRWAWFSRVTGVVFAAGFAGVATGSSSAPIILGFWVAVALAFAWLAAVSLRLYRTAERTWS